MTEKLVESARSSPRAIDGDDWLSDEAIGALVLSGTRTLSIAGVQQIGNADARRALSFIRFLRDAASRDLHVEWTARFDESCDTEALAHLEPPTDVVGRHPHGFAEWRRQHRYGMCYWRRGPGFLTIKDVRVEDAPAYYLLDDDLAVRTFELLTLPQRVADLSRESRDAVEALREQKLVLQLADWAVALPMRVRIWPIPYAGI